MNSNLPTQLESIFTDVQTKHMSDMPVINEKLHVKAIGFHTWNSYELGVLVTPWFMNLMLFPHDKEASYSMGSVHSYTFPSGSYDFVAGFEEDIGAYLSCSLFSPMFEFEDQEAAEATAEEALAAVMNEEHLDTTSQNPSKEVEQIWKGEKPKPTKEEPKQDDDRKPLSERLEEPTSRRDFLRGKAFRTGLDK